MTTILVADDDQSVRTLVRLTLELEGFTVVAVDDGDAAVAALTDPATHLDCAVIDVMMPHRDGIDVVRALRADPRHAGLPVILLSAKAQAADMSAGLSVGADRYLTKPFDPFDLVATITHLLAARGT